MKRTREYAPNSYYTLEIQRMIEATEVCLSCGKPLKYLEERSARRHRGYCCRKCFMDRPPKRAFIETEKGKPLREVLLEMLNEGMTIEEASGLLGVSRELFYKWLQQLKIKRKIVWR